MVSVVRFGIVSISKMTRFEYASFIEIMDIEFNRDDFSIKMPYPTLILQYFYRKNYYVPKFINKTNTVKLTVVEAKAFVEYFSTKTYECPFYNTVVRMVYDHIYRHTL